MISTEINTLFSVRGRVALITGGTSGIGLMIAKVCYPTILALKLILSQGLVSNGARAYVCGLASDPIKDIQEELNILGQKSGGSAIR